MCNILLYYDNCIFMLRVRPFYKVLIRLNRMWVRHRYHEFPDDLEQNDIVEAPRQRAEENNIESSNETPLENRSEASQNNREFEVDNQNTQNNQNNRTNSLNDKNSINQRSPNPSKTQRKSKTKKKSAKKEKKKKMKRKSNPKRPFK